MILARTPLRISIAGGGTDLSSYYEKFGGSWISAAINQYVFIGINRSFTNKYILRYSETEKVDKLDEIKHNAMREVLKIHDMPPVEVVSLADIPSGTGLGSSGTFTVCLLRAIHAFKRRHVTPQALAEEAYNIERWVMGQPTGKQDQYIAAFGGLTCFDVDQAGEVRAYPLNIKPKTLRRLEDNLLLFFTGFARSSAELLSDQKMRSEAGDQEMIESLHFVRELGGKIKQALLEGDLRKFGEYMHQHWLRKRERSEGMTNKQIDGWYDLAMKNGAVGGKVVGAGGGGFLLFYTEEPERLRAAMESAGLEEVRFNFDYDGPTVVMRD
ncbi:MAG: galactokinase [Alphaproteobacteria bacterium]|nr:galactokinase [Alphaproteobacteria bacterium]